jgi:hypothetical protein
MEGFSKVELAGWGRAARRRNSRVGGEKSSCGSWATCLGQRLTATGRGKESISAHRGGTDGSFRVKQKENRGRGKRCAEVSSPGHRVVSLVIISVLVLRGG